MRREGGEAERSGASPFSVERRIERHTADMWQLLMSIELVVRREHFAVGIARRIVQLLLLSCVHATTTTDTARCSTTERIGIAIGHVLLYGGQLMVT